MIYFVNDIKLGMMVKLRNGDLCVVRHDSNGNTLLYSMTEHSFTISLDRYDNSSFDHPCYTKYDIMQVFESPIYCDSYEMCERPHLVSPIIWERPKDKKKDTEERINEIFKEVVRLVEEYEKLRG